MKQYILDLWDTSDLCRLPKNTITTIKLSNTTKHILTNIGLPKKIYPNLEFVLSNKLYTLQEYLNKNHQTLAEYYRIGTDIGSELCIKISDETIWSLSNYQQIPDRFVNRNLENFLDFLYVFKKLYKNLEEKTDDEIEIIIMEIKNRFNEIDNKALEEPENWWSLIIEQMESGMI